MARILGVDPGLTGALALLDLEQEVLLIEDMPVVAYQKGRRRHREIADAELAAIIKRFAPVTAWVERVHAMPKQGVVSVFTFGMTYGVLRGVLAAQGVPTNFVTPAEWKPAVKLGADKQHARLRASQLFPQQTELFRRRCDDGRAEAALLAFFGSSYPL